jgi:hypothetical protein
VQPTTSDNSNANRNGNAILTFKFKHGIDIDKIYVYINGNKNVKSSFKVYLKREKNSAGFSLHQNIDSKAKLFGEYSEVKINTFLFELKLEFTRITSSTNEPVSIDEIRIYPKIQSTAIGLHDIDNDGDIDIIRGETDGRLTLFTNTGTAIKPKFIQADTPNVLSTVVVDSGFPVPVFYDVDNDGDYDIILGSKDDGIVYFKWESNMFLKQPTQTSPFRNVLKYPHSSPTFVDLNGDGNVDVMVGYKNRMECYLWKVDVYVHSPDCENTYIKSNVAFYNKQLLRYKLVSKGKSCDESGQSTDQLTSNSIEKCVAECKLKSGCSFFHFSDGKCVFITNTEQYGTCKNFKIDTRDLFQIESFIDRYYSPFFGFLNGNKKNRTTGRYDIGMGMRLKF